MLQAQRLAKLHPTVRSFAEKASDALPPLQSAAIECRSLILSCNHSGAHQIAAKAVGAALADHAPSADAALIDLAARVMERLVIDEILDLQQESHHLLRDWALTGDDVVQAGG